MPEGRNLYSSASLLTVVWLPTRRWQMAGGRWVMGKLLLGAQQHSTLNTMHGWQRTSRKLSWFWKMLGVCKQAIVLTDKLCRDYPGSAVFGSCYCPERTVVAAPGNLLMPWNSTAYNPQPSTLKKLIAAIMGVHTGVAAGRHVKR